MSEFGISVLIAISWAALFTVLTVQFIYTYL